MNDRTPDPLTGFIGFPPSGHTNCPMCNYPLDGLPRSHACPECGFKYDANTYVQIADLHSFSPKRVAWTCAYWLGCACVLIWVTYPTHRGWQMFVPLIGFLGLAGVTVLKARRLRNSPPLAGVSPTCIFHRRRDGKARAYPLRDIEAISLMKTVFGTVVMIHFVNGRTSTIDHVFRRAEDMYRFALVANDRLASYRKTQ